MSESTELSDEAIMKLIEDNQLTGSITIEEVRRQMAVKPPVLSAEEIEEIREHDRLELQKVIDLQNEEASRRVTEEIERQWAENKIKAQLEITKMALASGKTQLNGSILVEINVSTITKNSSIMITMVEDILGTIVLSEINEGKGFGISSTNSSDVGFVSWEVYN